MSSRIPTGDTEGSVSPVHSFSPVVLRAPDRALDLHLRVSAPATGDKLPIILLSHGHGPSNYVSSLYGYAPLANYYAAHGSVVIQPTHLDSATLGLRDADHPEAPLYWRSRAEDMTRILDELDAIESAVPFLAGRIDRDKVAVVGHSMGGHTASLLLGARATDPNDGTDVNLVEPRIRAGVLLAAPGRGGDAISQTAAAKYPVFLSTDFAGMTTPALIVAGDNDNPTHLATSGPAWFRDPFLLSPAPKSLFTVFGAEHGLGGVAGYDLAETTDENPERVAAVQQLTWAYLRSQFYPGDVAWQESLDSLTTAENPHGRVESR